LDRGNEGIRPLEVTLHLAQKQMDILPEVIGRKELPGRRLLETFHADFQAVFFPGR
jgi:hypothetical protein